VLSWGRVIVLLCFSYRLIVAAVNRGPHDVLLMRLVQFVVEFFVRHNIARWVTAHGGWVRSL